MTGTTAPLLRTDFVGLFGRQSTIDLTIPQWATIYIGRGQFEPVTLPPVLDDAASNESALRYSATQHVLRELVEGLAIIGVNGVTIIVDEPATSWAKHRIIRTTTSFINHARPHFRELYTNMAQVILTPDDLLKGPIIAITNGAVVPFPELIAQRFTYCIDAVHGIVAKTTLPVELMTDAIDQIAAQAPPRAQPHWKEDWSLSILVSTAVLLLVNMMAKPKRFNNHVFLLASDYMDQMITNAFNDRNLRARWRKPPDAPKRTRKPKTPPVVVDQDILLMTVPEAQETVQVHTDVEYSTTTLEQHLIEITEN